MAIPTAYKWIRGWNSEGVEGLRRKKIPGRPPKLPTEELEDLKSIKRVISATFIRHIDDMRNVIKRRLSTGFLERSASLRDG